MKTDVIAVLERASDTLDVRSNCTILRTDGSRFTTVQQRDVCLALMPLVQTVFHGVDFDETLQVLFGTPEQKKQLLLAVDNKELIAFGSYRRCSAEKMRVLIVSGVIVDPPYQGRGIFKQLLQCMCSPDDDVIALTTQSPKVMATVAHHSCCQKIWPQEGIEPPPLAMAVVQAAGSAERYEGLICRNATQVPMYDERPWSRDEAINNFFRNCVGPCDRVFVVGELGRK